MKPTILTLVLASLVFAPSASAVDEFWGWTGGSTSDPDWDNVGNWAVLGGSDDDYPGQSLSNDAVVIIDDTTPLGAIEQNVDELRALHRLFIGDGHTLVLEYGIDVGNGGSGVGDEGRLSFEGDVTLDDVGIITAEFVFIYSEAENTVVDYDGAGSGAQMIVTIRD